MRYPSGHKEKTRKQIIETATRAFREEGIPDVGIGKLMGRLDLTHGGFYAHFPSKDALVAEACIHGFEKNEQGALSAAERAEPGEEVRCYIEAYLSQSHRDDPATGCSLPALAADISRQSQPVRHAFSGAFTGYLERVEERLPGLSGEDVLALVSGLAGAMLLARAVDDSLLSDRILDSSRIALTEVYEQRTASATL